MINNFNNSSIETHPLFQIDSQSPKLVKIRKRNQQVISIASVNFHTKAVEEE